MWARVPVSALEPVGLPHDQDCRPTIYVLYIVYISRIDTALSIDRCPPKGGPWARPGGGIRKSGTGNVMTGAI